MSISFTASSKLPTEWGEFRTHVFTDSSNGKEHLALVYGEPDAAQVSLCRVHSECLTGDALYSLRCDCGSQLKEAMKRIAENGSGVILYLRQEGRDIGLGNKIKAYALQDKGADTVQANMALGFAADERDYSMCLPMLTHLGIGKLKLMTNNPNKISALKALGIEIEDRQAIITGENSHNQHYLDTKRDKLGHLR